jgi:hypothetical protein
MRRFEWMGFVLSVALSIGSSGCSSPKSPSQGSDGMRVLTVGLSDESFRVDRAGGGDGSLEPDGVPDLVLKAAVTGPAIGVALVAYDARGVAVGQWDTFTGSDRMPAGSGLYSVNGDSTPGLVLYEAGERLNRNDGSISPIPAGRHEFDVIAEVRDVPGARSLELLLINVDGTIARGPRVAFTPPGA